MFILRLWHELREVAGAPPEWRGVIEHVPSGERHYFKDLDEVADFIASYLEQWGVKSERWGRLQQWLRRWQHRRNRE